MDSPDLVGAGKVGDGPGNPQHSVETAGGEAHRCRGVGEQLAAGIVRRCYRIEQLAISLGIGAQAMAFIPLRLHGPCRCHPGRHLSASLRRWRKSEVGGADALHFDMKIDAVEQGA